MRYVRGHTSDAAQGRFVDVSTPVLLGLSDGVRDPKFVESLDLTATLLAKLLAHFAVSSSEIQDAHVRSVSRRGAWSKTRLRGACRGTLSYVFMVHASTLCWAGA